jgi:hypothetical protein
MMTTVVGTPDAAGMSNASMLVMVQASMLRETKASSEGA